MPRLSRSRTKSRPAWLRSVGVWRPEDELPVVPLGWKRGIEGEGADVRGVAQPSSTELIDCRLSLVLDRVSRGTPLSDADDDRGGALRG